MKPQPETRQIGLRASKAGVYRVRLIGDDPTSVAHALLTGMSSRTTLRLVPGDYTAVVENLATASRSVESVCVPVTGGPTTFVFNVAEPLPPSSTPNLRPSRAMRQPEPSADSAADGQARRLEPRIFSVGISVDTTMDQPGGWVGDRPKVDISVDAETKGILLIIRRCEDWRIRPKWRLTVSVEKDHAWRVPLPLFDGGLRVRLAPTLTPHGPDVIADVSAVKASTAALVGGLNRLDSQEAQKVIAWSVDQQDGNPISLLAEEMNDPWAAAAAAVLMVRTGQMAPLAGWVDKLDELFPWLADAAIAAACSIVARGERSKPEVERACLKKIMKARRRGASPYFMASNALALEILNVLAQSADEAMVRAGAKDERANWSRHSRRALRLGAIMSWEHDGSTLRSGKLPRASYDVVASGRLTADEIECVECVNAA